MKVKSREYKLLVSHEWFADPDEAIKEVWDQIEEATEILHPKVRTKGKFDEQQTRTISFLDTPDHTLRRNGLVLRQRAADDSVEYTLKCRSEDRYFAAGTEMKREDGPKADIKFEEDIACPFICRFSHSATVILADDQKGSRPKTLDKASKLFPVLNTLRSDGKSCDPQTNLEKVYNITVEETVWKGGKFVFDTDEGESTKASLALILWARGKGGRPAVAELSFRIKGDDENYSRNLAEAARSMFMLLQRLDCSRTDGITKTEYIYRDSARD